MYSTTQDIISKQSKDNDFQGDRNRLLMKDFNFLPSIQFTNMDSTQAQIDSYGLTDSRNEVNMMKVNDYVNFVLNIKIRKPEGSENTIKKFRPCTEKDFHNNGIVFESPIVRQKTLEHRICPDIDKNDEAWKVVNGYSNEQLRHSFSLMLTKCSLEFNSNCKNDTEIAKFLNSMFFTVYVVGDEIVYNENAKVEIVAREKFLLQFQGDLNAYKDSNNFLVINQVTSRNERIKVWKEPKENRFFTISKSENWVGGKSFDTFKIRHNN